jgi:nucleoid-associated protein YgaU
MKTKYVLKNKKRFSMFVSLILVGVLTAVFATSVYGYREPSYMTVTVRDGDTLWDIAKQCKGKEDIRKTIFNIKKYNHLANSEIFAGTELVIPMEE